MFNILSALGILIASVMITLGLIAVKRSWKGLRSRAATPEGQAQTKELLEAGMGRQFVEAATINPRDKYETMFMSGFVSVILGGVMIFSIFSKMLG